MISFLREVVRQHYLILFIAIFSAIFWPQIKEQYYGYIIGETGAGDKVEKTEPAPVPKTKLFTKDELAKYNGEKNSLGLYLSIMGTVYDVQKGAKHYGEGGSYHFFAGRDASVSFISGDFENITDTLDDVLSLEAREILSLKQWKEFYDKDYILKGRLIGRFYDENGHETEYYRKVEKQVEIAIEDKRKEEMKNQEFPPCNIEWSADTGTKVWCTTQSGGIDRHWTGFPRKYFQPGEVSYRCACVHESNLNNPNLKEYDDCDASSRTCFYEPDN
ncbi:hypothetical protein HA402_013789 [Bradysia odoriphaga]|nr:hypothetical protein HA402_013789 [Bradysia odoriphaga]